MIWSLSDFRRMPSARTWLRPRMAAPIAAVQRARSLTCHLKKRPSPVVHVRTVGTMSELAAAAQIRPPPALRRAFRLREEKTSPSPVRLNRPAKSPRTPMMIRVGRVDQQGEEEGLQHVLPVGLRDDHDADLAGDVCGDGAEHHHDEDNGGD